MTAPPSPPPTPAPRTSPSRRGFLRLAAAVPLAAAPTVLGASQASAGTAPSGVTWRVLPPGADGTQAVGIWHDGTVVGNDHAGGVSLPWVWRAGRKRRLGLGGAASGRVDVVGRNATVVGTLTDASGGTRLVRWLGGRPFPLAANLPADALVGGVNDLGDALVYSDVDDFGNHTRVTLLRAWGRRTTVLPTSRFVTPGSYATGPNNRRELVIRAAVPGDGTTPPEIRHHTWRHGVSTPMPVSTVLNPNSVVVYATWLSDNGWVGFSGQDPVTGLERAWVRRDGRDRLLAIPAGLADDAGTRAAVVEGARTANARGHVTGWATAAGVTLGVLWRGATATDLGRPPGGGVLSEALVLNDVDALLVNVYDVAGNQIAPHGWLRGRYLPLPLPPGATAPSAIGMNNRNEIVGSVVLEDGANRVVVWRLPT